jgi:hypothetical protein
MTTEPQVQPVTLYNGMPDIKVLKTLEGYYQWVTIKHAVCTHSLLCEVKKFMDLYGYKWHIVKQTKEDLENEY